MGQTRVMSATPHSRTFPEYPCLLTQELHMLLGRPTRSEPKCGRLSVIRSAATTRPAILGEIADASTPNPAARSPSIAVASTCSCRSQRSGDRRRPGLDVARHPPLPNGRHPRQRQRHAGEPAISYEFLGRNRLAQSEPVDAATTDTAMPYDDMNQEAEISRSGGAARRQHPPSAQGMGGTPSPPACRGQVSMTTW